MPLTVTCHTVTGSSDQQVIGGSPQEKGGGTGERRRGTQPSSAEMQHSLADIRCIKCDNTIYTPSCHYEVHLMYYCISHRRHMVGFSAEMQSRMVTTAQQYAMPIQAGTTTTLHNT